MRGRPFPKGIIPHNKTPDYTFTCVTCGKEFIRTEAYIRAVGVPKTCCRTCHNRRISAENKATGRTSREKNGGWKGGIQIYRQFKKEACERCSATRFLIVHHRDRDRYNNADSNLETLCRSCHAIEHDIHFPNNAGKRRMKPQTCVHCGVSFYRTHIGAQFCKRSCYFAHRYPLRPAADS